VDEGFRVTPEPTEAERAALLAALAKERAEEGRTLAAWTVAGLREAVEKESDS
jgi:hypothetical protein